MVVASRATRHHPSGVIHPIGVMPDHPGRREGSGMTTDPVARIAKNWWLFLVLGVVSVIAGVLAIVYPDLTLLALGIFAGVSLLLIGITEVVEAISGDAESRALTAIVGVLSLIVRGVYAIITAFRVRGLEHEPGAAAPA
jgi:uncharacterized membrane protein HdeD (DUF308 family)